MITLKGKGFTATRRPKEKLEMMYVLAQSDLNDVCACSI